jgi:hypothetical protein
MAQPEKLNLWDRFFNRYRKEIVEQGRESWFRYNPYIPLDQYKIPYERNFVKYKIIDRITGSESIEMEYLS